MKGGARDELVTGRRGKKGEKRGGGKEGAHSWVIQHGRAAASGWTEGGMDGWRGKEEG